MSEAVHLESENIDDNEYKDQAENSLFFLFEATDKSKENPQKKLNCLFKIMYNISMTKRNTPDSIFWSISIWGEFKQEGDTCS